MEHERNNLENLRWNASHLYASHFPYIPLDENHLRHIINFTMIKGDAIFTNASGSKYSVDSNETTYECNVVHDTESGWFSTEFQATLHFMYITIFIIAILGNGMVCFIVCQSSRMQTVTNYFIANLALADMSMAFFCIPFSFISLFVLQ
jgi:7 transmembrane receptor (rhodopsin family)